MKRIPTYVAVGVGILVAAVVLYLSLWPVPIDPVAWEPAPDPGFTGPFAQNHALAAAEQIDVGLGPEDITKGPDGLFYTGLDDGRIVRFDPDGGGRVEEFASTDGRPLGMHFDAEGNLIVADAFRGLISVAPDGAISVLTDSVDGEPMIFVDDLDISTDGKIWFSDASQRFDQRNFMLDFIEGSATGRLLSYDATTGETTVHLENLGFANGVALGPDDAYVLVNETQYSRITRLWLTGPRAGERETFIDSLPGAPDNLSYNDAGIFWVALPVPRLTELEGLAGSPFRRRLLMRIPGAANIPLPAYGWVIGLDTEGNVVHNLQDPSAGYSTVTSVNEIDGFLYLGSIAMMTVGRIAVPDR